MPTLMEWSQGIVETIFYIVVIGVCTLAGAILQTLEGIVHLIVKIRGVKKET